MSNKRIIAYTYLLIAAIIWGVAGPVIKYTLDYFPPLIFLEYRFFLASILGVAVLLTSNPKLPRAPRPALLILLVCFLTTTMRLGILFFGFEKTTSISGNVIGALAPLFIALAGAWFLREKLTRMEKIGISIALIGTLISAVEPVFASEANVMRATILGNGLVLLSVVMDVASTLLTKVAVKNTIEPETLSHLMFIVGFVTLLPPLLYQHRFDIVLKTIYEAPRIAHLGVLYMAFLSGTLAYMLNFKGLKMIEAGEAGVFAYLIPLFGIPVSIWWLDETISGPFVIGAVIIVLGVIIAEYKRKTASK